MITGLFEKMVSCHPACSHRSTACAPTVFISRFLMWRCGLLVVMTRKVFWNAYRQRYVKILRNRPFSPQIIRENLWFGFKATNSLFTQFFYKDFSATNSHKFPQTIFLLNLVESVWAFGSKGAEHPWDFPPTKKACEICAICVRQRRARG